ncbi:MAG: hypothetical protein KDD60_01605 [Bdellovibrionales bacterium]|nr:hypothetical protein [Bdellovibrionales bacterium]
MISYQAIIWRLLVIVVAILSSFASVLSAQPMNAEVSVFLPNGTTPAPNTEVRLIAVNDVNSYYLATTDTNGFAEFVGVAAETDYSLKIEPRNNSGLPDCGLYADFERAVTLSRSDGQYDNGSDTQTLADVTLSSVARYFQLQLTQNGSPLALAGVDLIAGRQDLGVDEYNETYTSTKSNSAGIFFVGIPHSDQGLWSFDISGSAIIDQFWEQVAPAGSSNFSFERDVLLTDATIVASLTKDGDPYPFPSDEIIGGISCRMVDGEGSEWHLFQQGESSASLSVPSGDLQCAFYMDGHAAAVYRDITVASGKTANVEFPVYLKDMSTTLRLVDETSRETVSGSIIAFTATSGETSEDGFNDSQTVWSNTGEGVVDLVANRAYRAYVQREADDFFESQSVGVLATDEGKRYVLPLSGTPVQVSETGGVIEIPARSATATLIVQVTNADGSPVTSGYVDAWAVVDFESADVDDFISTGADIQNGTAEIPMLAGREYVINAYPPYSENQASLLPKSQRITLSDGETKTIEMQFPESNHELNITGVIETSESSVQAQSSTFFSCSAINGEDNFTFLDRNDGELVLTLPLFVESKPTRWGVFCYAVVTSGQSEFVYVGQGSYLPKKKSQSGELQVVLREQGSYLPLTEYSFDASREFSTTLEDGKTTIRVPAKAIADSGTVTMSVESGKGYTFSDEDYPLSTYDFKFEVGGEEVTDTQLPVDILIQITAEELESRGASPEDLRAGSFNDSVRAWREDATFSYDEESETITLSVNHFSIWGVLIDTIAQLRRTVPRKLKVKDLGSKGATRRTRVSWEGPDSEAASLFELDILQSKSGKSKKRASSTDWSKAKTVTVVGTKYIAKLKSKKKYQLRVRMAGGGKNSATKKVSVK